MRTDILVIGAGPGGYTAAIRGAQLGMQVAIVEEKQVGGICLNHGCIPTKALLACTDVLRAIQRASDYGINVDRVSAHLDKMMARKDKIVSQLVKGVEYLLSKNNVTLLKGRASFKNRCQVQIIKAERGIETVSADNVIIATGSEPLQIPGLAPNGQEIITSTEALALEVVPERLVIIGAGVVGLEMATFYSQLGSQVTIVEMLESLLPDMDKEIADLARRSLKRRKINLLLGKKVTGAEVVRDGQVHLAIMDVRSQQEEELTAEKVLLAIGRRARIKDLGLEKAGVITDERGFIRVNDRMETSAPGIYAVGDVVGGKLLAHKASHEGITAAERIRGLDSTMDYRLIPNCIFTYPEMASVGLTEEEAKRRGYRVKAGRFPFRANGRAWAIGEAEGLVKVVAEAEHGEILGVHIIGPQADTLIAEAVTAMKLGATARDLATAIHAHPTLPESLMEAALNVYGRAIHG